MKTPPRSGGADMEEVLQRTSGSVCNSRDFALSPLVFPHSPSSSGTGRYGTDICMYVCFPPIALLPGVLERVHREGVRLLLVAPYWPGRLWFVDLVALLEDSLWEIPVQRDLLSQAGGTSVQCWNFFKIVLPQGYPPPLCSLCGCYCCLPCSSGRAVFGEEPASKTFPQGYPEAEASCTP